MNKFIEFYRDGQPIYINKKRIIFISPCAMEGQTFMYLNDGHTIYVDGEYEDVKAILDSSNE